MTAKALTPKQEAFSLRYLETGNASDAYRHAYAAGGMKPESVNRSAAELLANPKIASRLDGLKARQLKRHDVTIDRVLAEYAKLAFLDIRKAFDADGHLKPVHDLDDDTAAAIAGIEVEVRRAPVECDDELEPQPHGGALPRRRGETARVHKLKLSDKRAALDSLAKHLGMFVERAEVSGPAGGPILTTSDDAIIAQTLALLRGQGEAP